MNNITKNTNTEEKAKMRGEKDMKTEIIKAGGTMIGTALGKAIDGGFKKGISDNELIAKTCSDGKPDGLNGMWGASQTVSADVELAAEYKSDDNCDKIVQEQIKIIMEGKGEDDPRFEMLEKLKQAERKENAEKENNAADVGREKRRDNRATAILLTITAGFTTTLTFAGGMLVKKFLR